MLQNAHSHLLYGFNLILDGTWLEIVQFRINAA